MGDYINMTREDELFKMFDYVAVHGVCEKCHEQKLINYTRASGWVCESCKENR